MRLRLRPGLHHRHGPLSATPPSDPAGPAPIEDYALIGDCATAALVSRDGTIDWLCLPRFDSGACFAALLGTPDNGSWRIAPAAAFRTTRAYRDNSLVLETRFATDEGEVVLIDFMPPCTDHGTDHSSVVRMVRGLRGQVTMAMALKLRFDYGSAIPWVEQLEGGGGIRAIAGPDLVALRTEVELEGRDLETIAEFTVSAGETVTFTLSHGPSHLPPPPPLDADAALEATDRFWSDWASHCTYDGPYRPAVLRSLLTLKALTYAPTGGIVAAATTSLPEQLGGVRNWDYRFCWLRDASLTLQALMFAGHYEEAQAWSDWLQRSAAGAPEQIRIMYGVAGERRLPECELDWLPGYQGAKPVRIGNAAAQQLQLDAYGEVLNALHHAACEGLHAPLNSWSMQRLLIEHLAQIWREPDEGIWEVRGGRQHFTYSKIMAWVAVDRAIATAERFDVEAPLEDWQKLRAEIHETVCREGFDEKQNSFTQAFGSSELDASLLLIPQLGFLPPNDPRVIGTVAAIERRLLIDGFVRRYHTGRVDDGLPEGEGAFLACSFWLADAYALQGREPEARALFERLLALCNDVGLLSEEYDSRVGRLVGNFPQAFSHTALVRTALGLAAPHGNSPQQAGQSRSSTSPA